MAAGILLSRAEYMLRRVIFVALIDNHANEYLLVRPENVRPRLG